MTEAIHRPATANDGALPTKRVAGVIFDCDGTLVDSEPLNALALSQMLACDHGVQLDPVAVETEFRGGRFEDMTTTLAARHALTLRDDFTERYRTHAESLFERQLEPMPGVRAAIEAIDLPRCVASSGPPGKLAKTLAVTDLKRYFGNHVFSAYDLGVWKPEPDLFLQAAAAIGVVPSACAVVEDSDAGVEAARRAGMRVFGYDPHGVIGAHPNARLTRFTDFAALPELIAAG